MPDPNLAKLQQISNLRKQRSERLLQEAKSALSNAEQEKNLAEQKLIREQSRLNEAKLASYKNPASEQVWIWQAASQKSRHSAAQMHDQKNDTVNECSNDVKQAGQAFIKAKVKQETLEAYNRKIKKAEDRRTEDNIAEEQEYARFNSMKQG